MKNLCEIFRLPKWAKISLVALSGIAIALLVSVFALQKWADNQLESANLTFSKIDKAKSADLAESASLGADSPKLYAYEARVHFPRLEFLLRSKSISKINIENIAWSGIDSSAITSYESHNNRRVKFTTTQNLNLDSGANLGIMSYKMDFSPLPTAIIWYYLWIVFAVLFASLMLSFGKASAQGSALLGGGERTFA